MRKGQNPAKSKDNKIEQDCFHQVIVPVYLPKLEGYYEDGLEILKLCLNSIYLTIHEKTYISVVNNGSCDEVKSYLNELLEDNKVHEVIHTTAIGKINAIAKGLAGHDLDLVTITDADVLFTNGWQKAVYDIYESFPKTGMVCTTPHSKMLRKFTEIIYFDNLFNSKFKFRVPANPNDMFNFALSVGNRQLFNNAHLSNILSIEKQGVKAVVGAGHFCSTYKKEILNDLKTSVAEEKISPINDRLFIDIPSARKGHWRLSTFNNYTFHLGNEKEKWMNSKFQNIKLNKNSIFKPILGDFKKDYFVYIKRRIIEKIFFNNYVWRHFLIYLGLKKMNHINFKNYVSKNYFQIISQVIFY